MVKIYDAVYFFIFHSSLCFHYFSTLSVILISGTRVWFHMLGRLILFAAGNMCVRQHNISEKLIILFMLSLSV